MVPSRKMVPARKEMNAFVIATINQPVISSSSAILHWEGSVFHSGAGGSIYTIEVRFVTGSSQQGT